MSQGDYIKYKRTAVELSNAPSNIPMNLVSSTYTDYKQFVVENITTNTSITYFLMKSTPLNNYNAAVTNTNTNINAQQVFGMERKYPSTCSSCVMFPLSGKTNGYK